MDLRDNGRIMRPTASYSVALWDPHPQYTRGPEGEASTSQEGKTMEYTIISGDGHIDLRWLPHDLFVSHAPAPWKDQVPHVRDTPTGKHWSLLLGSRVF